jgi:hypothetical protein
LLVLVIFARTMKRKTLSQMLLADDPTALLVRVMPDDGGKLVPMARKVLAAALAQSRREGGTEPAVFYAQVCDSDAVALGRYLSGTAAGKLAATSIARAQVVIKDALTNHAGRPKVSPLTRKEQFAAAQRQRYEKERNEKGRQLLHGYISDQAMAYLISVQQAHDCSSRGEAVDMVLCAASHGTVIAAPASHRGLQSIAKKVGKGGKDAE